MMGNEAQAARRRSKHCEGDSCMEIQARPGLVTGGEMR